MELQGPASRLRIYVGEADRWQGERLAHAIVLRAREHGLAGATVARGIGGFGTHHRPHDAHLVEVESNLPEVVEIIDSAERITAFLTVLEGMVRQGLVTRDDVRVVRYRAEDGGD